MDTTEVLTTTEYRGTKYVNIDTVIPSDQSYWAHEVNGRQGDNMRLVNVCLRNDGVAWNLGNYTVDLVGRDAEGVLKATNTTQKILAEKGLIRVSVPKQFYQSVGDYQEAFLEIKDNDGTVISSVRVAFTVWANNTLISRIESKMYLGEVNQFMKQCEDSIDLIQNDVAAVKQQSSALNDLLQTYMQEISRNAVATLGNENTFTADQHVKGDVEIDGTLTANALAGGALNTINSMIDAARDKHKGEIKTYKCNGINGAVAGDNLEVMIFRINDAMGYAVCHGNITLPAMKGGTFLEVISAPDEAIAGGRTIFPSHDNPNYIDAFVWSAPHGDDKAIFGVYRNDNGTASPDPEYIEFGYWIKYE